MNNDEAANGWTRVRFGDVVRNANETSRDLAAEGLNRIVGLDHLDPGNLRLTRWDSLGDLSEGTTFTRKFKPGQVLFGKRRVYQHKVAVPDFEGVCSGDILVFEPADQRILAEFLPYVVQAEAFFDHALGTSAGSLSPRTKWQELAKYEFSLPPIEVQAEILAILKGFDQVEAAYQDLPYKELITSFLGHLDRRLDGSPVRPGEAGWTSVRLGEVMTHLIDQVAVIGQDAYELAGIYSYGRGLFSRGSMEGRSTQYHVLNRLHANDFVVSKLKAWEGAVAMVTQEFDGAVLSPEFPTFRLDPLRLDPSFMGLLCRRPQFWSALGGLSSGTVNRRTRVHPTQVLTIKVLLPPLDRQKVLVEEFQELQRASSAMIRALEDLTAARRAAIDSLLNGGVASVH